MQCFRIASVKKLYLIKTAIAVLTLYVLAFGQDVMVREGRIKSACIYHIIQFVDWPKENQKKHILIDSKIRICTAGEDPLNIYLNDILKNKTKYNSSFEVVHFKKLSSKNNLHECDLLYLGELQKTDLEFYLSNSIPSKTLLISSTEKDHPNVLMAIYKTHNKIGINIKLESAKQLGYKISSELLQIAILH